MADQIYYCGWNKKQNRPHVSDVKDDEDCVALLPVPAVQLFIHEADANAQGFAEVRKVKIVEVTRVHK